MLFKNLFITLIIKLKFEFDLNYKKLIKNFVYPFLSIIGLFFL